MNQPASQQCLHCVCGNAADVFEHFSACWNSYSYASADKMKIKPLKNTAKL